MNCSKWVLPLCKTHSNILPTDRMFDTMWNRDDAVLQSTLGFMLPVKAEDSLLLYYRQYSRFFFCFFSQQRVFFFPFSLALRHIFLHILVQYVKNTVMVTWVHITSSTEQSWLNQTDHGFIHYDRLSQPEVHLRRDRLSLFPCER